MEGTVRQVADRQEIRFERHLKHPVEQVWRAITEPAAMISWLAEATVDVRLGGEVSLRWLNAKEPNQEILARGTVSALEPLHVVEYDTDIHGRLRWELEREGEGTLLIFTCTIGLTPEQLLMNIAGWHMHMEHLADALNGAQVDWLHWWTVHFPRWQELHERYVAAMK